MNQEKKEKEAGSQGSGWLNNVPDNQAVHFEGNWYYVNKLSKPYRKNTEIWADYQGKRTLLAKYDSVELAKDSYSFLKYKLYEDGECYQ